MIDVFKYEKRYKYAHMKPADIAIWERFIEAYPQAYDTVQYDFNVGDPPPFNPLLDDGTDLNQDALYRLKIDVVGHNTNRLDIIELKPNAGPSTIGQIKGYKTLFLRDEKPTKAVSMVIITNVLRPNMQYLCESEGVKIVVV
jgi:hypothetical protein